MTKIIWILTTAVLVLTYSPLIIAPGKTAPMLGPLPFVLWAGFLSSLVLMALVVIAIWHHRQKP